MNVTCMSCGKVFESKRITKKRCPDCHKASHSSCCKRYYEQNKDTVLSKGRIKALDWYYENRDKTLARCKQYRQQHLEEYYDRTRKRYHTNPMVRLKTNVRNLVYNALQKQLQQKTNHTQELCGCSWEELKLHLESQFVDGMSWDNQGEWHVDHIRPCASFDLSDLEQLKSCFHYTNLQPLWAEDNIRKGSLYEGKRHFHPNQ